MIGISLMNFHHDVIPFGWYDLINKINPDNVFYFVDQKWNLIIDKLNNDNVVMISEVIENNLRKRYETEDNLALLFAKEYIDELVEFYDSVIKKRFSEGNEIQIIYSFCSNKSLEKACKNNGIRMKYIEFSPLRNSGYYDYYLAWFNDRPVMFSRGEGKVRYKEFEHVKEYLIIDKPIPAKNLVLLGIKKNEILQFIKNTLISEQYDIGIGLPGPKMEINNGWMPGKIIDAINERKELMDKSKIIREHPGHNNIPYILKDKSKNSLEFVSKCKTVISSGSNITFEAMLLGKNVVDLADIFYADFIGNDLSDINVEFLYDDWFLNFMFFGAFVPFERLFDEKYIEWRMQLPGEDEIFNDNYDYFFSKLLNYDIKTEELYDWEAILRKRFETDIFMDEYRDNNLQVLKAFSEIDWKNKKVYITGTGRDVEDIKYIIENMGGTVNAFVIMDDNQAKECAGLPVINFFDYSFDVDSIFVLSQRSALIKKDVCKILAGNGYENIIVF